MAKFRQIKINFIRSECHESGPGISSPHHQRSPSPVLPDSIPPNCIHLSFIITPSAVPHCHRLHALLSLTIMPGCFLIYLICLFTHLSSQSLLSDVGTFYIISQMSAWTLSCLLPGFSLFMFIEFLVFLFGVV